MLSKVLITLLAVSAAVIAAPASVNNPVTKHARGVAHYDEPELPNKIHSKQEVPVAVFREESEEPPAYEELYNDDDDEDYEYELDVYEFEPEVVHAKRIVCPAYYKIIYVTVPVKCDCTTETIYGETGDIDFDNIDYEEDFQYV